MTRDSMHEWFWKTKRDKLPNAMKANVNFDVDVVWTWIMFDFWYSAIIRIDLQLLS